MRIYYSLALLCLAFFGSTNLQALTQYTGPANGSWFTATNWDNGLPGVGNDAFLGGGTSVVIGSPLNANFNIQSFGTITANAAITNGGTFENSGTLNVSATGSLTNNATFQNFGTTTFSGAAGFTNETGATFTNGGPFTLQTVLVNRGTVTNNNTISAVNGTLNSQGIFNNNQALTTKSLTVATGSTFTNNFGATLNITGVGSTLDVNGSMTNNGTVNNSGMATVNGSFTNNVSFKNLAGSILTVNASATFTNGGGGVVENDGGAQIFGTFTNGAQIVNRSIWNAYGTFNNNNLITNAIGGTFTVRPGATLGMGFGSQIQNAGTFDNKDAINSFGNISNSGTFLNNGTLLSFSGSQINNTGNFTNNGTISTNDQVVIGGTFTNAGTINVNGGSVWRNNGSFTNSVGGKINVTQDFQNKATGTLTNNGTFSNLVRTLNEGNFINNAFLQNIGDLTNAAGATLTNNELLYQQAGNILNAGTLANTDHVVSDECSSIRNTGTINNTGNFEFYGILFQKGTLSGAALNIQGGYVHTAATSNAPSVCQDGSFGADINGDVKVYAGALVAFSNFDSCSNIIYLANGVDRPVFHCSDIGTVQNVNVVVRTRLLDSLTCVAQVTPEDLLEPQFSSCPSDIVIFTPNSTVPATWTAPTATDNCTTVTLTASHTSGSNFPVGITGVTYTAEDAYGNSNSCQFRIDVRQTPPGGNCTGDNAAPNFTGCPTNISVQANGTLTQVGWTPPTPSDNCFPITLTSTHSPGQGFPVGTTTVTYTAKDGNNNSKACVFTVTVTAVNPCLADITPPTISGCPANIYQPTNAIINGAVAIWAAPGAGDNCGVTSFTGSHVPGAVFPVGTTTVTYTAKDAANNTSTCTFTITVGADPCPGDVTAPVVTGCPANITILTTGATAVANWTAPTATDPCTPVTVNKNYNPGATFPLGTTGVTYQFSDKKGNKSTCSFTVTVQNACANDNVQPVITGCPANITVAANGNGGVATWTPPTATDNCGLSLFSASYLPGATFPVGTTTVVYTAIDLKGNSSDCSFNVLVVNTPNCTTNAAPINATTNVNPASVTLSWNSAANATAYDVFLGTTNPPTTIAVNNVAGTSTTVTGLASGTTYYWYVRPENTSGTATGCASSVTSFSTAGGSTGGGCAVTLGSIVREVWNTNTWNLNSIDNFGTPNSTSTLTQFALTGTEYGTNYMDRVRGFLVPSATGNYTFNVTGDDYVELFLSTNANPGSKQKIAWHYGYTSPTQYTKYASQTSATIALQAGTTYYIELRHLEGSGSDHFRVSWKTPSSSSWAIIPGARLAPYSNIAQPVAICKNITLQLNAIGQSVQINGQQLDNGSTAGCMGTILTYNASPTSFSQPGTFTSTLTVTNSFGLSSTCTSTVTVLAPACSNATNGGDIAKSCINGQTNLLNVNLPTGGSGTLEYLWISGTVDCNPDNMTPVVGGNGINLVVGNVSQTTYFIRCSRRSGCTEWNAESNCMTVNPSECNFTTNKCYKIVAKHSGKALELQNGSNSNGDLVVQRTFNEALLHDRWKIENLGNGLFKIVNVQSGKVLDVSGVSMEDGANIHQWGYVGATNQQWKLMDQGNGEYRIEAKHSGKVLDIEGGSTAESAKVIQWAWHGGNNQRFYIEEVECSSCDMDALFVVGSTSLNSGDTWVKNRLQGLGYTVTVKDDAASVSSDANGKGLVVISSTIESENVTSKFKNTTVPVVLWESYILDDMKMTGPYEGSDYGQNGNYKHITILDSSHPLAAGFSGTVKVYSSYNLMRWGYRPSSSAADRVARIYGQSSRLSIMAYDAGEPMYGNFAAPARRVSLFLDDATPTILTNQGKALFDAAIVWAANCSNGGFAPQEVSDRSSETSIDAEMPANTDEITVYPNPATNSVSVNLSKFTDQEVQVRLFDSKGSLVKEWEVVPNENPVGLEFGAQSSGQYLLWFYSTGHRPESRKLIIEN